MNSNTNLRIRAPPFPSPAVMPLPTNSPTASPTTFEAVPRNYLPPTPVSPEVTVPRNIPSNDKSCGPNLRKPPRKIPPPAIAALNPREDILPNQQSISRVMGIPAGRSSIKVVTSILPNNNLNVIHEPKLQDEPAQVSQRGSAPNSVNDDVLHNEQTIVQSQGTPEAERPTIRNINGRMESLNLGLRTQVDGFKPGNLSSPSAYVFTPKIPATPVSPSPKEKKSAGGWFASPISAIKKRWNW